MSKGIKIFSQYLNLRKLLHNTKLEQTDFTDT
jgi:hypothetical protein